MSQNDPRQLAWFEYPFDRSRREKWEVKDRILYAVYLRAFQCLAKLDVAGVEKTPKDADIVITHESLVERVRHLKAEIITITNFVGNPIYDELVARLKA